MSKSPWKNLSRDISERGRRPNPCRKDLLPSPRAAPVPSPRAAPVPSPRAAPVPSPACGRATVSSSFSRGAPTALIADHGGQDGEELAHAGDEGDLVLLAACSQRCVCPP